jgi:hypothetical protein
MVVPATPADDEALERERRRLEGVLHGLKARAAALVEARKGSASA